MSVPDAHRRLRVTHFSTTTIVVLFTPVQPSEARFESRAPSSPVPYLEWTAGWLTSPRRGVSQTRSIESASTSRYRSASDVSGIVRQDGNALLAVQFNACGQHHVGRGRSSRRSMPVPGRRDSVPSRGYPQVVL
jgi:hypothetical protein